jgi:PIN domain nuclease of toxin-antitoxin system
VNLLLDSHALLWALYEPEKLPPKIAEIVADLSNELFVSHATILELANKTTALRLPLVGPSPERMLERIEQLGATFLPIRLSEILAASHLPPHHSDPIDRILIAQAQAHDLTLITKDPKIANYAVKTIWR